MVVSKQKDTYKLSTTSLPDILQIKGKEWPLFVTSCCFAMNTFVSTTTGFSPYELVFLKKPPDILNLYF